MITSNTKILKTKTVLDFSRLIPGPFCTKILADMGARVIKIEDKNRPDGIRLLAATAYKNPFDDYLNGKKKRLILDWQATADVKKILVLVKKADVLVESFRPGVMAALGFSAVKLHKINPGLIYVSLTGYGQKGELAQKAGHDINFMAESGMLKDFLPVLPRFQIADFVGGGLFAALEILAAMIAQKKRLKIDVSMTDSLKYLAAHQDLFGMNDVMRLISGKLARYHLYESADGVTIALGALEEKFWQRFCEALEGAGGSRTAPTRLSSVGFDPQKNQEAILELQKVFAAHDAKYWKRFSNKHDVCLTVVL